ncbi:MAG: hypothetical protein GY795_39880 [Desulfobacterales bacterium]|nr:hypothetical protein [Desulfobacterales bacterium]
MNLFAYDITIAYSDEKDMADIAMLLRKGLQKEGMRIRLFDVSTGSCLEAMRESHFFVPILTDHYLTRTDTVDNLNNSTREILRDRRSFTFYPVIPIVGDMGDIQTRTKWPAYHKDSFNWLNSHVFPVSWNYGTDWLVRFFNSLVLTAKNKPDPDFLYCLFSEKAVSRKARIAFEKYGDNCSVRIFLKNPVLTYYTYHMSQYGEFRFMAVSEPDEDSLDISRFLKNPVHLILKHLNGELEFDSDNRPIFGDDELHNDVPGYHTIVESGTGDRILPVLPADDPVVSLETDKMANLLLVNSKKHVGIYDLRNGSSLFSLPGTMNLAKLSGDGKYILTGNSSRLCLWDINGNEISCVTEPESSKASWSGNGSTLAVGHFHNVSFLNPGTLEQIHPLQGQVPSLFSLNLSHDGSMLAVATIYNMGLWDSAGELIGILKRNACYSAVFDEKRNLCFGSFFDGQVVGFCLDTLQPKTQAEMAGPVLQLDWLTPDKLLIRYSMEKERLDGPVAFKTWDVENNLLSDNMEKIYPLPCPATVASETGFVICAQGSELSAWTIS